MVHPLNQFNMKIKLLYHHMILLVEATVPSRKKYVDGTVPSSKKYLDGTVPSCKKLVDGTVSVILLEN